MWRVENRKKNLLQNKFIKSACGFGRAFLKDALTSVTILENSTQRLVVAATESYRGAGQCIPVIPGKTYTFTATNVGQYPFMLRITGRRSCFEIYADASFPGYVSKTISPGTRGSLTYTPNTPVVIVTLDMSTASNPALILEAEKIQFEEGSVATDYEPPLNQSLESSLELFGYNGVYDEITSAGLVVKRWGKKVLTGKDNSWIFSSDYTGWKTVKILSFFTNNNGKGSSYALMTKFDGVPLKVGDATTGADILHIDNVGLIISVSDSDSGWADDYTPTDDDVKRYFNGWKYVDGTTWQGIGSSATADATTALNSTVKDIDPDADWKPYVVIYQLATPEIQKLDYSGELILYPGKNYLVTDSKTPIAISIKGAKKYLEG